MEFILETQGKEKICRVVDVSELMKGSEDGLVQIHADGLKGNTLISHCQKHDISRYGRNLWEMLSAGWRPFVFVNVGVAV